MKELEGFKNEMLSSRRISEKTGKQHYHVLRDIRAMMEDLSMGDNPNLDSSEYQIVEAENGTTQEILLNERLSLCLASGYSVVLRMAIIDDWVKMKAEQLNKATQVALPTKRELALMLIESEDRILELESEIKEMTPKAETFEKFISTEGLYSNAEAGKMLGIGQNRLCQLFRKWKVYNEKNVPYQRYIDEGCFHLKVSIVKMGDGEKQFTTSFVTPKGLDRLRKKFQAEQSQASQPNSKLLN